MTEVSRESTKQTKMIAEQESNFRKACDNRHHSTKLLKKTFKLMNLNEIKHSKRKNVDYQITPKFICQYIFCFVTKSSVYNGPDCFI